MTPTVHVHVHVVHVCTHVHAQVAPPTVEAEDVLLSVIDLHCIESWQVVEPNEAESEVLVVNQF